MLTSLSVEEVCALLHAMGLGVYDAGFRALPINGLVLSVVGEQDLTEVADSLFARIPCFLSPKSRFQRQIWNAVDSLRRAGSLQLMTGPQYQVGVEAGIHRRCILLPKSNLRGALAPVLKPANVSCVTNSKPSISKERLAALQCAAACVCVTSVTWV